MVGQTLREQGFTREVEVKHVAVKESVFPFIKFPGVDSLLGPEMKSTGEVMGIGWDFGTSFFKAQLGAGLRLPLNGTVFISVNDKDKPGLLPIARRVERLGFKIVATKGTMEFLREHGVMAVLVLKLHEGRPNIVDAIKSHSIHLVINTPNDQRLKETSQIDDQYLRRAAILYNVPYTTTLAGATAAVEGIEALRKNSITVMALQDYHRERQVTGDR